MKRIWIDTDIGGDIDDALALVLAIASEGLEIAGVSTVFENTVARARIARRLLDLGGLPRVPVHAGIGLPRKARSVHRHAVDTLSPPKTYDAAVFDSARIDSVPAVEAMAAALMEGGPMTLVTLGALTNIACLLERYPRAASEINALYIMGGAVGLNLNEFNFTCDPEAACLVLRSTLPKRLVTLDTTFQCRLTAQQVSLLATGTSPLLRALMGMHALWGEDMILHDPLTLGALVSDGFVGFEKKNITVELEGRYSRGKCVDLSDFNWREHPRDDLLVSTAVRPADFCEYFVNRVCALDRRLISGESSLVGLF